MVHNLRDHSRYFDQWTMFFHSACGLTGSFSDFFNKSDKGWSCELQEELRWLRDRRIGTDLNLGIYGDAHADIILACTDANFLRKVNSFIENLSEEEKVKPDIPNDEEDEEPAPPQYEECDALTAQEKEDMNKAAEKNLKMLEEKLKMLEAMVEKEEEEKKKKLRKISECPALENEDQEQTSTEAAQTENLIDIETEETTERTTEGTTEEQTEASLAEEKSDEPSTEATEDIESTEDQTKVTEEPLVTLEGGPEEPKVVEENLKQASKDEDAEKEEEEKRHAEKEKEALAVANQTIEYIESKSGIVSINF